MIRWPLTLFAALAIANRAHAATPEQLDRVDAIADRLDAVACSTPRCAGVATVLTRRSVDAWTDGKWIAVTSAMLANTTDDELAFVIGHEMAHNEGAKGERQADRRGQEITSKAGYDPMAGARLLRRLDNPFRTFAAFTSFKPTLGQRAAALEKGQ